MTQTLIFVVVFSLGFQLFVNTLYWIFVPKKSDDNDKEMGKKCLDNVNAELNDPNSQYSFGNACADGVSVEGDLPQNFTRLLKIANQGCVDAQSAIGRMYFLGERAERNFEESYFWYSIAAKAGKPKEWADSVARYLKPDRISAIEKRVAEWTSTK